MHKFEYIRPNVVNNFIRQSKRVYRCNQITRFLPNTRTFMVIRTIDIPHPDCPHLTGIYIDIYNAK